MITRKVETCLILILTPLIFSILIGKINAKNVFTGSFSPSVQDMEFAAAEPRPVIAEYESPKLLPLVTNVSELQQKLVSANSEKHEITLQVPRGFSFNEEDQLHEASVQEISNQDKPEKVADRDSFTDYDESEEDLHSDIRQRSDEDANLKDESRHYNDYEEYKESDGLDVRNNGHYGHDSLHEETRGKFSDNKDQEKDSLNEESKQDSDTKESKVHESDGHKKEHSGGKFLIFLTSKNLFFGCDKLLLIWEYKMNKKIGKK